MEHRKFRCNPKCAKANRRDYKEGRKPVGTRRGEPETIARMLEVRKQGLAYDTIAERLNNEGIPARAGRWHATSVMRVLKANS